MNPIWKKIPDFAIASFIAAISSSESAGGFSQKVGLPRRADELPVRVGRADDDDGFNRRIVDERLGVRVVPRDVEFGRHFLRQRSDRVGNGHQPCLSDAAGEVPGIDAAQAADADQSNGQTSFTSDGHFTLSLVTSSSFTLISGGTLSPRMTFTALSTAARPISDGNCATDASIVPAAIAFFASSSASKPITWIWPVLPAAAIASMAPSAIRSLQANTLSMS